MSYSWTNVCIGIIVCTIGFIGVMQANGPVVSCLALIAGGVNLGIAFQIFRQRQF